MIFIIRDLAKWLAVCYLLVANLSLFAAPLEIERQAIEHELMNLRLAKAEELAIKIQEAHWREFYLAHIAGYRYLCTQSSAYIRSFRVHADDALEELDKLPSSAPEKRMLVAELEGKRAALEFAEGNAMTALWRIKACYSAISDNAKLFPKYEENNKILGIFNVVFSSVPKKYQWISNNLGFVGNLQTGLKQLDYALESGTLLRYETFLVSYHIDKNLLSDPTRATTRLLQERNLRGGGMVVDFLLAGSYLGQKKNEEALQILAKRDKYANDPSVFFINYWDYFLAKAYYYSGKYPQAQEAFSRYIAQHKGDIYRTDAIFRLGMSHVLSGNYAEGQKQFKSLLVTKPSMWDEDEYASAMAKKFAIRQPTAYELQLFKSRNYYDGGYFNEALKVLYALMQQHSKMSYLEKTEFHYRMGRVYEAMKNTPEAIKHYEFCTQQPPSDEGRVQRYLKAYSFLYMGELHRAAGNAVAAKTSYQRALALDDFFYQAGLESKCKAALKLLK